MLFQYIEKILKNKHMSILCDLYHIELQDSAQHKRIEIKYNHLMFVISKENHSNTEPLEKLFVEDLILKLKPTHANIIGYDFSINKYLMNKQFMKSIKLTQNSTTKSWNKIKGKGLTLIHKLNPNVKSWIKQVLFFLLKHFVNFGF